MSKKIKINLQIGNGEFEVQNKSGGGSTKRVIKLRCVTEADKVEFLNTLKEQYPEIDITDVSTYFDSVLKDSNLIEVNWTGMSDFSNEDGKYIMMNIAVETKEQWDFIMNVVKNPKVSKNYLSCWYPLKPQEKFRDYHWNTEGDPIPTRHPIYVISKGRFDEKQEKLTWMYLKEMGIPFKVVVETQEYQSYLEKSKIPEEHLMKLPEHLCNLGQGGIPVRNYVWEHSKSTGHTHHWILDDNIKGFYRLHQNLKSKCKSGVIFNQIEDFMDKYSNLYYTGMGYCMDNPEIDKSRKGVLLNTKVFSCILIRNNLDQLLDETWRGKYNEDIDLSLRILKSGLPIVQFQCFLADKCGTQTCKGGNTDGIYKGTPENKYDGLQKKLDSLIKQHPDCVTPKNQEKPHHKVDYSSFKGKKSNNYTNPNPLHLLHPKQWTYNTYPELKFLSGK